MNRSKHRENDSQSEFSARPNSIFYGKNQKVLLFGFLLLLVIYHFGRPSFEKMLGMKLPPIFSDGNEGQVQRNEPASQNADDNKRVGNSKPAFTADPKDSKFQLKNIGRDDLQSPAGLVYGMGPRREHRVDHVMRHAEDDSSRPVHSVFEGDRDTILTVLDEAYSLIKEGSKQVRSRESEEDANRMEHIVDLRRPIGYRGGQNGKRDGYPKLYKVKFVLEKGNHVITAFPY